MNSFTIQAETLRSTAKNLRILAQRYQDDKDVNQKEGEAILEEATIDAEPFFKKAKEFDVLAKQQTRLAEEYESAANILSMR
jgi:hypothetical protein